METQKGNVYLLAYFLNLFLFIDLIDVIDPSA
jgi:hypothetical protein